MNLPGLFPRLLPLPFDRLRAAGCYLSAPQNDDPQFSCGLSLVQHRDHGTGRDARADRHREDARLLVVRDPPLPNRAAGGHHLRHPRAAGTVLFLRQRLGAAEERGFFAQVGRSVAVGPGRRRLHEWTYTNSG